MSKYYKSRNPNLRSISTSYAECGVKHLVTHSEFTAINFGFMKFIVEKLLNGEKLSLPCNTGKIEIVGNKIKPKLLPDGRMMGVAPDWVGTKKLRESNPEAKEKRVVLYHFNEHSNGIRYKFRWYKLTSGMRHRSLYAFKFSRPNKRALWKKILEGKEYRINGTSEYKKLNFT